MAGGGHRLARLVVWAAALAAAARAQATIETARGVVVVRADDLALTPTLEAPIRLRDLAAKVDGLATNLTAFMANVTNSLAALQQQLTTLDGRVGGLDTRLQASVMEAASNLSTVKTELAGSLTGLTKSLGDAAANITQLQAATSGLAGLDARVQSLEGQDTGTALRFGLSEPAACTASTEGSVFYNRTAKQTMLCNSATYVPIYQPAVGSRELPAASCQQIVDEGDSFGSGKYYVVAKAGNSVLGHCDMTSNPAKFMGASGEAENRAAPSCAFIKTYFPELASDGLFYILSDASDPLDMGSARPRACITSTDGKVFQDAGGNGKNAKESSTSCRVMKVWWDAPFGVYWINGTQELCDTNHPDGVSLGGDGTASSPSTSCDAIRQHQKLATGSTPPSAVYYLKGSDSSYRVYCSIDDNTAVSHGGDGTTAESFSESCKALFTYFEPESGVFWVSRSGDVTNNDAEQHGCDMRNGGVDAGFDGTSASKLAVSCTTLRDVFKQPTGAYFLKNVDGTAIQVHCDMGDDGGWMRILHYSTSPYTPTPGAVNADQLASTAINGFAKHSDAFINQVTAGGQGGIREFKITGNKATAYRNVYLRTKNEFNDRSSGLGLIQGGFAGCQENSYGSCTFRSSGFSRIDTGDDGNFPNVRNTQDRYFTDYSHTPQCYGVTDNQRCFSCGSSCGHNPVHNLVIWARAL